MDLKSKIFTEDSDPPPLIDQLLATLLKYFRNLCYCGDNPGTLEEQSNCNVGKYLFTVLARKESETNNLIKFPCKKGTKKVPFSVLANPIVKNH